MKLNREFCTVSIATLWSFSYATIVPFICACPKKCVSAFVYSVIMLMLSQSVFLVFTILKEVCFMREKEK